MIFNKIDLTKKEAVIKKGKINKIYLSAKKNYGINHILGMIKMNDSYNASSENTVTARKRHLESSKSALTSLYNAKKFNEVID